MLLLGRAAYLADLVSLAGKEYRFIPTPTVRTIYTGSRYPSSHGRINGYHIS